MESQASKLLQMLEPAIRPNGIARSGLSPKVPIEQQSFDAILQQAHQVQEKLDRLEQMTSASGEPAVQEQATSRKISTMAGLGGIGGSGGAENASLIRLLGQAGQKE